VFTQRCEKKQLADGRIDLPPKIEVTKRTGRRKAASVDDAGRGGYLAL
jgi:hypothetical protein